VDDMPSKFPHGAPWWAAVTSAVVVVVIGASIGITIWRYETAVARGATAADALDTARTASQLMIEFGDEQAGQPPEAGAAVWARPGGGRPAMGNGHVTVTAGAAESGGAR
jgi:hypothetical protein